MENLYSTFSFILQIVLSRLLSPTAEILTKTNEPLAMVPCVCVCEWVCTYMPR